MQRTTSRTTRLARLLANLGLVVVMLGCAVYLLPTLLGYQRYVITGGSMTGSIDRGSIAFEKERPVAALEVGDVITYLPPSDSGVPNLVTHRVVEIGPGPDGVRVLRTRGDANENVDPWTFSLVADTQPVEEFSVPLIGYVFMALNDRETRIVAIGGPAAVVALFSLVELATTLRGSSLERRRHTSPAAQAASADPAAVTTP